jgi:hypothetical protein
VRFKQSERVENTDESLRSRLAECIELMIGAEASAVKEDELVGPGESGEEMSVGPGVPGAQLLGVLGQAALGRLAVQVAQVLEVERVEEEYSLTNR